MGVKNLIKFIEKYAPSALRQTRIDDYVGTRIGIDANLLLYKLIYAVRANGYDITNDGDADTGNGTGNGTGTGPTTIIVTHIHALLLKLVAFRRYRITPIFVFDARAPAIKEATLKQREDVRQKMVTKYKDSTTDKGKRIYYYIKSDITRKEIRECRKLIEIFNYVIIDAKEEADAQLAQLYRAGVVDAVASDDMDLLLFGAGILLKNFTVSPTKWIQEIRLDVLLDEAAITQDQLIQIGILLGTDYCDGIPRTSPTKAYKLIEQYGDLHQVPSVGTQCDDALEYFRNPPVHTVNSVESDGGVNIARLVEFLQDFRFKDKYIDRILDEVEARVEGVARWWGK